MSFREFKIWANHTRTGLYYKVQVFNSAKEMHAYCKKNCMVPMGHNAQAICHSFFKTEPRNRKQILMPHMGDIHFTRYTAAMPHVVVHECLHAAIFYARRMMDSETILLDGGGIGKYITGVEEGICEAGGNLFLWMDLGLYSIGVWK